MEEAFAETEKTYNEINTELHEMLPNFYQGCVLALCVCLCVSNGVSQTRHA